MWAIKGITPLLVLLILCFSSVPGQGRSRKLCGYTIMAGGLGRPPRSSAEIWPNTEKAHLEFITHTGVNLVVVEIPYGVNKKYPKSATTARFIKKLKALKIQVWIIYPHVLAQTFDLPRQVDQSGKKVEWKCCFNQIKVQDWLVENGKQIVAAYQPDGLVLFGTFQTGRGCLCPLCRKKKPSQKIATQEKFFCRMRGEISREKKGIKLGTCCFWVKPSRKTLSVVDMICPVVPIFRPGYNGPGQVKRKTMPLKSKYRGKLIIPYVKLFLATQTNSTTLDVLAAVQESVKYCDGFFFWGYNPGHSYNKQVYDHEKIGKNLKSLMGKVNRRRRGSPR